MPEEVLPTLEDGYSVEQVSELNLKDANINTVIWATEYSFDFSMVQLPISDADGYPIQKRGVTEYPGLYFVGLSWLHNAKSGLLFGVAQDAAHIAAVIDRENRQRRTRKITTQYPNATSKTNPQSIGHVVRWYVSRTDIEDRKRAEREVQQIVDAVPQQIVVLSADGGRLYSNQVTLDFYSFSLGHFEAHH